MGKVLFAVIFMLLIAVYGAFFIQWNPGIVTVVGMVSPMDAVTAYGADLPIAYLAIGCVFVGVIIMGVAACATWGAQRDATRMARAQVEAAKVKLEERTEMVRELRAEVRGLRKRLEE